jgi:hypothetical protein
MLRYTALATFIIAFTALIQLCPAPFLVLIPEIIEVAAGAAEAASEAAAEAAAAAAAAIPKRSISPFNTRSTTGTFPACIADATLGNSPLTAVVGTDTIQVDGTAQNWAIVNSVPASCISQVNTYNSHPNISDLNAIHGTVKDINSTSILLYGMPQSVFAQLQAKVKH